MGLPSTFLEIVQEAARECRVPGTGPSTVIGQTGLLDRLVSWTITEWVDIQNLHKEDWNFLRQATSWTTVAGTCFYTLGTGAGTVGVPSATFGSWIKDHFRLYTTATGTHDEHILAWMEYQPFLDLYQIGANRDVQTRPSVFTIDDSYSIGLGPAPAAGYTVTGDYRRKPVILAADADVPACPREYFMLIVYAVMKKYGAREGAARIYQAGATEYNKLLPEMERQCLVKPRIGWRPLG